MTPNSPPPPPKGTSGRLVVIAVVVFSGILGFGLLGWMFSYDPDTVDFDQSGPIQPNVVFPPPIEEDD